MIVFDVIEAIAFGVWSYWRIITTGHYPSSRSATKGR